MDSPFTWASGVGLGGACHIWRVGMGRLWVQDASGWPWIGGYVVAYVRFRTRHCKLEAAGLEEWWAEGRQTMMRWW